MAILTISVNSNYSAIKGSLANGDTIRIDTDAVRLTVDEQPLLTNITVDSPGFSGRMTVSGAYDLSTWSIVAGTVALIDGTFPAGATLGSASASPTVNNAFGITANAGTVLVVNGGGGTSGRGVSINNGTVSVANGGSGASAPGVNVNNGTVGIANGGSNGISHGVLLNNGSVTTANGGSHIGAFGVGANIGNVLRAFDSTGLAIGSNQGGPKLIIGPDYQTATTSYTAVPKIYSIGEVSNLAAIPGTTEIVILSEGSGGGFPLSRVLN
jgi:hypothetical protein